MNIALAGFGDQNQAAFEYWNRGDNTITVLDTRPNQPVPPGITAKLGPDCFKGLDEYDLIVRSPGVHPRDLVAANSLAILNKVTTVTNEFFKVCPSKYIVGVTGTKGKGTTSTLIARLLEAAGATVHLGGNIGIPPLTMLKNHIQPDDWVVLELANYQIIDLKYSPEVAVCLMVAPEHLDWHKDMAEYLAAKKNIFTHQSERDRAIYNAENHYSTELGRSSLAEKVAYDVPPAGEAPKNKAGAYVEGDSIFMGETYICKTKEVALLGRHNLENVCAAIAAVWDVIGHDVETVYKVVTTFHGLEHRLELVRELDGIKYYDDSFGTTPETASVAIEAFAQPKVLILGGYDKGAEFNELARKIEEHNVRAVVLIGVTAPKIEAALKQVGYKYIIPGGDSMQSIVATARSLAKPGDVVLFSTASASFDMFKNYKDRGDQFKQAVTTLS